MRYYLLITKDTNGDLWQPEQHPPLMNAMEQIVSDIIAGQYDYVETVIEADMSTGFATDVTELVACRVAETLAYRGSDALPDWNMMAWLGHKCPRSPDYLWMEREYQRGASVDYRREDRLEAAE